MSATYLGRDSATLGSWVGVYGSLGHAIPVLGDVLPAGASISVPGASPYTWGDTSANPLSLRAPDGSPRNQSVWYAEETFDVELTLAAPCVVSLYVGNADLSGRQYGPVFALREGVDLLDTQVVTVAEAAAGMYVRWKLDPGSYEFTVANGVDSVDPIVNGIFFDTPPTPPRVIKTDPYHAVIISTGVDPYACVILP